MIFTQKKQRPGFTDIPSRVRTISDSIERGNLTDIKERRRTVLRQSDIKDRLNANIIGNKIVDITAIANGEVLKYNATIERLEPQSPFSASTTDDLPEGSTNLYFTDERAQDAVGTILVDTVSINFTYDDITPKITADVIPGGVDASLLDASAFTSGSIIFSNGVNFEQDNANLFWDDTNNIFLLGGITAATADISLGVDGSAVFNEQGNDSDFRIEGDTDVNLFFVDASQNRIGIGIAVPNRKFEILDPAGFGVGQLRLTHTEDIDFCDMGVGANGNMVIKPSGGSTCINGSPGAGISFQVRPLINTDSVRMDITSTGAENVFYGLQNSTLRWSFTNLGSSGDFIIQDTTNSQNLFTLEPGVAGNEAVLNDAGLDYDLRVEGDTDINLFFVDASADSIAVGTSSPSAKLHVDQASTTAAIPALFLDQADISEEMIEFNTTIGTGNPIEAVAAKTLTGTHFLRVTLPGGLSRYFEVGTIA